MTGLAGTTPQGAGWRQSAGLVRPRSGWWAWLADTHFIVAGLAAVPVWALLGFVAGDHMAAPADWRAWTGLLLVLPIAEECVFRGLLQGQLQRVFVARRVGPVSAANVLTTAGFVMAHLVTQPVGWALAVACPALVFGHLRERHASVLPAIVLHTTYNAGFGAVAWCLHH